MSEEEKERKNLSLARLKRSNMKLPYVIDNQTHVLADIFKGLLMEHIGRSAEAATAYFTVGGFGLVNLSQTSSHALTSSALDRSTLDTLLNP